MKLFLCAAAFGALAIAGFFVGANADGLSSPRAAATMPAGGATVIVPEQFASEIAPPAVAAPAPPPVRPARTAAAIPAKPAVGAPPPAVASLPAIDETPRQIVERLGQSIAEWFATATGGLEIEYLYPADVDSGPAEDRQPLGRGRSEEV